MKKYVIQKQQITEDLQSVSEKNVSIVYSTTYNLNFCLI